MVEKVIEILLAAVLVILSVSDIKNRKIPIWILGLPVLLMAVHFCLTGDYRSLLVNSAGSISVFLVGILISRFTGEAVGAGDAYVCGAVFMILGIINGLISVTLSLFFAAFFGTAVMHIKKKGWKYRIPFVPFLCGGYICTLLFIYL